MPILLAELLLLKMLMFYDKTLYFELAVSKLSAGYFTT